MADSEALLIAEGKRPETADGRVGCVMLVASGQAVDDDENPIKFFEYRPAFFADIIHVRWDADTMLVVLPVDVTNYLLRHGYARVMNGKEAQRYNAALKQEEKPPASPAPETPARKTKERNYDQGKVSSDVRTERGNNARDAALLPVSGSGALDPPG